MNDVRIDEELSKKLQELTGQTFLCDSEGRILGTFSPCKGRPRMDELQLEPPSTIEEIRERRKNRSGSFGKPLDQILEEMGIE